MVYHSNMEKITLVKRQRRGGRGDGFEQVSLRIPSELADELRRRSEAHERSLSATVRLLLRQGLGQPVCGGEVRS